MVCCASGLGAPADYVFQLSFAAADDQSALSALVDALENLDQLAIAVNEKYKSNLTAGKFERFDEQS